MGKVSYYFETTKFILKFIFQPVIIPVDKSGSSEKQTYKPPKYGACQWLIKSSDFVQKNKMGLFYANSEMMHSFGKKMPGVQIEYLLHRDLMVKPTHPYFAHLKLK